MKVRVCSTDDLWEGEIQEFAVGDIDVLIAHAEGGDFHAYESKCPHQDQDLADASFENNVLTCPAHLWQFDITTGRGINPAGCKLKGFELEIIDNELYIDLDKVLQVQ